ncbi:MAG: hypothetical protein KIT43_04245 [Bauldia sp.]|nr:hypothetical protein [Bauldia sp.]
MTLTEQAYLLEGLTPALARMEAQLMRPDMFFFLPPSYFLVEPGIADADFLRLRDRMRELWALSDALGCGVAFHPVPES